MSSCKASLLAKSLFFLGGKGEPIMLADVMTVSEVAQYLRVNPQTVYRKVKAGELPTLRIGRGIRFRRVELDAWLKESASPNREVHETAI